MDAAGCLALFNRSIEKPNARYMEFLGDGDSKAHEQLVQEKVYGEEHLVKKLDCVAHIQKRMGSRLRSLKRRAGKRKLADGRTMGGDGRLTNSLIDSLQVYYGKAIRNNVSNIEDMKNAVMAIFYHSTSTDAEPKHDLCPKGDRSWCGFQRDLALGQETYSHSHPIPPAIAEESIPSLKL